MSPSPSSEEAGRLQALHGYNILDTPPEEQFDRVASLAARWFEVPIALIALLGSDRQWFKATVGLDRRETSRKESFCTHHIYDDEIFIVEDATEDDRFRENPLVTGPPGIRFYVGAPLTTPTGHNVGALCLIDTEPRETEAMDLASLRDLAAIVVDELELRIRSEDLEERQRQVQVLLRELSQAEEKARERLSHLLQEELHQVLQAARLKLQNLITDSLNGEQTEKMRSVCEQIDQAMNVTQSLSARFAPPIANQTLRDTFEWVAGKMQETHGLTVSVQAGELSPVPDETLKTLLYQVVRELLFNVVKHTDAEEAQLVIEQEGQRLQIVVEGGRVFDPKKKIESNLGFASVRERIEMLGGTVDIASGSEKGTWATIEVPFRTGGQPLSFWEETGPGESAT